jgi:flagella basal body P-ring formation protein FlgA
MRIVFAFAALFGFIETWACELKIPGRLLVAGPSTGTWPFESKNCDSKHFNAVYEILHDQDGTISTQRLQAAVGDSVTLKSDGESVRIENISHMIRRNFSDIGDAVLTVSSPFQGNLIELSKTSEFILHCHPCQFNGEEVMRLNVRSFESQEVDYSFQAKFNRQIVAYKARRNIAAFSTELTPEMFEQVKVAPAAYGQYLTDLGSLNYYKTNKPIRVGDVLKTSDLSPQTLVRAGDRVELIFENSHVILKSHALSRQNGGVGDQIEVWNQANGKKYRGTIIDKNRVQVTL